MKRRILLASVILLLALIVSAMIFAPVIARRYINEHGKELTGRTMSLKNMQVNYFTWTGIQHPVSSIQYPVSSIQHPAFSIHLNSAVHQGKAG